MSQKASEWGFKQSFKAVAERMFTIKHAVNSGQLPNRFMLSFFAPLSHTNTVTHIPSLGSHRCWQWWLWNGVLTEWGFQPQCEPLSLAADDNAPSILRVCISLRHLQNLYHHCSHPFSLCHVRPSSSLFCLAQLCFPLQTMEKLWAVMSLGHFFFFLWIQDLVTQFCFWWSAASCSFVCCA